MLRRVPASSLFVHAPAVNNSWLQSHQHFSFGRYKSPANERFGVLRVLNDDEINPGAGFGEHPHNNMEIVTYVVDGRLAHKDSMGTEEQLERGSVQFMTAGTGVWHSEFNASKESACRVVQAWVLPRSRGLEPRYGSASCHAPGMQRRPNQWAHLVSDVQGGAQTPIKINQDCNVHALELEPGATARFPVDPQRQAYFACLEGSCTATAAQEGARVDTRLDKHDAAEAVHNGCTAHQVVIEFRALEHGCHLLAYEMQYHHEFHGRADLPS